MYVVECYLGTSKIENTFISYKEAKSWYMSSQGHYDKVVLKFVKTESFIQCEWEREA